MGLGIEIVKRKEYAYIVKLNGSLDSDTSQDLEKELDEIINKETKTIIFDMGNVTYISSIGIGLIMKTKKALENNGAAFAMTNLQPQIKKVFDAVKILPIIDILDDMPEADKYIDQIIKEEIKKTKK